MPRLSASNSSVVGEPGGGLGEELRHRTAHGSGSSSGSRNAGLPAESERTQYGEPSAPAGPTGSICHTREAGRGQPVDESATAAPEGASSADNGSSTPARRRSNTGKRMLATRVGPAAQTTLARRMTPPCSGAPAPVETGARERTAGASSPSRR